MSPPPVPAVHVVVPCALRAAAADAGRRNLRFPGLESLLLHAELEASDDSLEQATARMIGVAGRTVPIGALRRGGVDPVGARDGFWICADPVATHLAVDNMLLAPAGAIEPAEAAAIIAMLNDEFGRDGLLFVADDARHWHVRCDVDQAVATTPLWRAIGTPVRGLMPAGDVGRTWTRRLNEVQMMLHEHPVNAARAAASRAPINSLWWWGEGRWPTFESAQIDGVVGGPSWLAAACLANDVAHAPANPGLALEHARSGRSVAWIVEDDWEVSAATPAEERLADWDASVFAPLSAALAARHVAAATVLFDDAGTVLRVHCRSAPRTVATTLRRWIGHAEPAPPSLADSLSRLGP